MIWLLTIIVCLILIYFLRPRLRKYRPKGMGRVWWVDWENGSDEKSGASPGEAIKTMQHAIDLAHAGCNDTIYLLSTSNSGCLR